MKITDFKKLLMGCMASLCLMGTSCSSPQDPECTDGTGSISLGVTANAAFTRAVNESSYADVSNYTVQILNHDGGIANEFLYSEKPDRINLNNGSYTLKAFYGTESNASRDGFYVAGEKSFIVEGEEVQNITVECNPTCGKVKVNFATNMSEYFSNYSVVYETAALTEDGGSAIWQKDDTEPWYLKVNAQGETVKATIHYTRIEDNVSDTKESTHTLAPGKSWTLNIAPQDNNGGLGITVTVDETTDDEEIDIEVPSEWL